MTFTVIEKDGNRYTVDVESLEKLTDLAEHYGWSNLLLNVGDLTIEIVET